jgi:hypothetical protein
MTQKDADTLKTWECEVECGIILVKNVAKRNSLIYSWISKWGPRSKHPTCSWVSESALNKCFLQYLDVTHKSHESCNIRPFNFPTDSLLPWTTGQCHPSGRWRRHHITSWLYRPPVGALQSVIDCKWEMGWKKGNSCCVGRNIFVLLQLKNSGKGAARGEWGMGRFVVMDDCAGRPMRRVVGELRLSVMTMLHVSAGLLLRPSYRPEQAWEKNQILYQLDWTNSTVLAQVVVAYPCCYLNLVPGE